MRINRLVAWLIAVLALAQLLLAFLSWLLSAMMVSGVRSLLSSEAVRWFFGDFTAMLSTTWLVSLLLLSISGGCLWRSGLLAKPKTYRERTSFHTVALILLIYIVFIACLTVLPHAVLLSTTGRLFPSPFSRALIPIVAFALLLLSATYGLLSGRFKTFFSLVDAMSYGIVCCAPLFLLYIFLMQFLKSLNFVFQLEPMYP